MYRAVGVYYSYHNHCTFQVMSKWEESSALVTKRDEELQELFEKINKAKDKVKKKQEDLKEQRTFLQNEMGK